jgi:DNA-binding protein HU-beta
MNKKEFVSEVAQKTGLQRQDVKLIFEASLDTIKEQLKLGNDVRFIGFGTFKTSKRSARRVKVPNAELMVIPKRKVATFKASKVLNSKLAD